MRGGRQRSVWWSAAGAAAVAALATWSPAAADRGRRHDTDADAAPDEPPAAAAFEDPCVDGAGRRCRRALDGFYAALAATEAGTATAPVRITYLGDSLVADDKIADHLRHTLGARFGDGGPGFVPVVPPHPYCRYRTVKRVASASWRVHGVATPLPADRLLGYGGGSVESHGRATARITPLGAAVTRAEIYYLAQPGGGELTVSVDGAEATRIATARDRKQADFATVPLTGALGRVELSTHGRVRLFGVVLEAARGLVIDNLGVVNATARGWTRNRADHWKAQLAHRAPDLVIVMIGANEAAWLAGKALAGHQQVVADLLAPIRAANPRASCLVVSPLDQVDYEQRGLPPRPAVAPMVEAQRRAAAGAGCAFWDALAWMGGPGSSRDWREHGWITNDFAHPNPAGDRRIAGALAAGLLDGYARYRNR